MKSIGIDFGGTSIKLGVIEGKEVIEHSPSIATQEYANPNELISAIAQFVKMLSNKYPDAKTVGMGMPGFVDFHEGTIFTLTNVSGWNNIPVRDLLRAACDLPVVVDNDANCMAYAEWKLGAGKNLQNVICLTLGTGVGSGLIINGALHRGSTSSAGELGQTSIDYKGRLGHYGTRGALEDYIGNKELAADARTLYAANGKDKTIVDCSPLALEQAALNGDPIAQRVWDECAKKLASALINCCFLLNPDRIVIGGGVAKAKGLLFDPLIEYMNAQLPEPLTRNLEIVPASLGTNAGVIGAATLAQDVLGIR